MSASTKTASGATTVEMGAQSRDPSRLVAVQPAIDRIGLAPPQQAGPGHGMGTHPIGDLQQGGTPLAHLRMLVVIADLEQYIVLLVRQFQLSALHHGSGLLH